MRLAAALLLLAFTISCSGGPLEVQTIQVGKSLNTDGSVATISTSFKPGDTVYCAVLTTGGSGTIGVRWLYGSQVIDEPTKQVSLNGPGATEFHLQNSGGFPQGDYTVEVIVDGKPAGKRGFKVD